MLIIHLRYYLYSTCHTHFIQHAPLGQLIIKITNQSTKIKQARKIEAKNTAIVDQLEKIKSPSGFRGMRGAWRRRRVLGNNE